MDWDKPNRKGYLRTDDKSVGWIDGGHLELTVDNVVSPGYIGFQFKVNLYAYEPSTVNYKIFVNGNLVLSESIIFIGKTWSIPYKNVSYFLEEEDVCGSGAPECNGEPDAPEVKTKQVLFYPNVCIDKPSRRGTFLPHWSALNSPYNVEVCFNKNEDMWNYNIENDEILFEYQLTNCLINQQNLYSKLVRNIEGLNNTDIPKEDFCEAYKSFNSQKIYGHGGPNYFISEATAEHEKTHKKDWIDMLNKLSNEWGLAEWLVSYKPNCDDADSYETALEIGEKNIERTITFFNKKFKKKWEFKVGKEGSLERKEYEQDTQDKVVNIINRYIKKLKSIYPELKAENCN